jgi:P27 family predicted phage terminase small subunit
MAKSPQQHLADGTYRKDRHGDKRLIENDTVLPKVPEVPSEFPNEDKQDRFAEWWGYYCQMLVDAGILVTRDLAVIRLLCKQHLLEEAAEAEMEGMEYVENEKGTVQAHPAHIRRETALRQQQTLLVQLGLTPAARSKVGGAMKEPTKETPLTGRRRGQAT